MVPQLAPNHEIVVFDNGSSDGTSAAVAEAFPDITLIRQSPGIAFTAARNHLLRVASGEYAISLDDDAEIVTPGFAGEVLVYFERNPNCAVMSFSIYWGEDLPQGIHPRFEEPRRVTSFVGCGHAWRMEAWRSIPEYPEWFEFYGEENFASLQLFKRGLEVHYCPQILVHHRVNTSKRKADERQRLWRYSRLLRTDIFVMLVFYPLRALPTRLLYVLWTQIRRRLIKEHDWRTIPCLLWVAKELLGNLGKIHVNRAPLNLAEWRKWNELPAAVIFWNPEQNKPAGAS
jgi:GT2 family glycosyltransferase